MHGIEVLKQVVFRVGLLAIDVDEVGSGASGQEVFPHGIVVRGKDCAHICDAVVDARGVGMGGIILVPAQIVLQVAAVAQGIVAGIDGERAALRTRTHVAQLEDGVDQCGVVGHGPVVVVVGDGLVEVGRGIIVHHTAEDRGLGRAAQHVGHVARRHEHVLQLVDVAVLASHVLIDDLVVEDIGRGVVGIVAFAGKNLEVGAVAGRGDVVVHHLLPRKVHHHGPGSVLHKVNALIIIRCPPAVVLWHLRGSIEMGHGVGDAHRGLVLQRQPVLHRGRPARHVGEHAYQQCIVEHGAVEQQFLLRHGELFVARHAPGVALEETLESLVIGREHRLAAGARERRAVAQVVNQPQVRGKRAREVLGVRVLQRFIDASSEPRGLVVFIHFLVLVHAGSHQSHADERETYEELFHKSFLVIVVLFVLIDWIGGACSVFRSF